MRKFFFGLLLLTFVSSCASVPDRALAVEDCKQKKDCESNSKQGRAHFNRERP
jgi:hypothetical protein